MHVQAVTHLSTHILMFPTINPQALDDAADTSFPAETPPGALPNSPQSSVVHGGDETCTTPTRSQAASPVSPENLPSPMDRGSPEITASPEGPVSPASPVSCMSVEELLQPSPQVREEARRLVEEVCLRG